MGLVPAYTIHPNRGAADKVAATAAAPRSRRHLGLAANAIGVALGTALLVVIVPGVAQASPPVGTCTQSYTALTYQQAGMLPDPALAQAAFIAVNANGDAYVCYKPYPNGPHDGHFGNFVDNTAAPHQ